MKQFLGLLLLLLLSVHVNAQTALGLKLGFQNTDLFDYEDASSVTATNYGLILNFGYSHVASFQMEVNYSPKGSVHNFFDEEQEEVYNYIEMPLLLKLNFGANNLNYYGLIGGFAAVPYNIKVTSGGVEEKGGGLSDGNGFDRIDIGLQVGAGLSYNVGPGRIFGELRYATGFEGLPDEYVDPKALLFSVGYLFTFGNK